MYVITAHQRHRRTDGQTDRQTDVKRSHDRYIAKACSGKNVVQKPKITHDYITLQNKGSHQHLLIITRIFPCAFQMVT